MSSDFDLEAALERMRKARPLVHNITNDVVMNVTANALLAAGASPAMVHAPEEAAEFVRVASALVVNIGTLTAGQLAAMLAATAAARDLGLGAAVPWVLDPVAVGATRFRRDAVTRLLAERPTVIRGNASEILAVATGVKAGRGVDADGASADMAGVAASLARSTGAVVAVTGVIDHVSDGTRTFAIANGHSLLARITGSGCTATALVGAFLGAGLAALDAAVAGLVLTGLAGERAAKGDPGPGAFQVRFLDALASITPRELAADAKISRA
jgi:hydroxyethylthiazole kinase